jgi:hypothetical protein
MSTIIMANQETLRKVSTVAFSSERINISLRKMATYGLMRLVLRACLDSELGDRDTLLI